MLFEKPAWKDEAERRGESLPGWYTLLEASKVLGHSDSSYLARLAREYKIISYKIGKYRLIDSEQLQMLIDKK